MPEWTPEQKNAITARGGTVLVSAAAGSGKTAVLVERVVERICDETDPCDINEMLIVTFTRMAAGEMRERIAASLARRSAADPSNRRLARQQVLIDQASIGTIDSFCAAIVRENFHALGIPSDFGMLDETDAAELKRAACGQALEELYAQQPSGLAELRELFSSGRTDIRLEETVIRIDDFIMAYPFPEEWLEHAVSSYDMEQGIAGNAWGALAFDILERNGEDAVRLLESCCDVAGRGDDALAQKAMPVLSQELDFARSFLQLVRERNWDGAYTLVTGYRYQRLDVRKTERKDLLEIVKARRNFVKDVIFKSNIQSILCATEAETAEDFRVLRPVLALLLQTVRRFEEIYRQLKAAQNQYDFSDIMHFALRLLVERREGGFARTSYAGQIAARYREIMVDEYQDVNAAQELLFRAISEGEQNLFFVGDVKQSIYGFRQSMPHIFIHRREAMAPYDGSTYPACITLGRNFRSRRGVTGTVNYIFSRIMSERAGDVAYNQNEALVYAASYGEKDTPDVTFAAVEEADSQPECIARMIVERVQSAMPVGQKTEDGIVQRPVRYGDICVLLRYYKNHVQKYVEAFERAGIPVRAAGDDEVFSQPEVRVIVSLLRVIDNPVQDIPLIAVLLSPLFGFTEDDLALIRAAQRGGNFYTALCAAAQRGDERCRDFLQELEELRDLSAVLTPDELLERIYDRTDYPTIAAAGKPDAADNLEFLLCCARSFQRDTGIGGFVRYIDSVMAGGGMKRKTAGGEGNAVSLMSIHKSKGLEYPVCFLAECETLMSNRSYTGDVVLHSQYGAGMKRIDIQRMRKFDTVANTVAADLVRGGEVSEGLRLLYVALTRAREELVMVAELPKLSETAARCAAFVREDGTVDPAFIANSKKFSDWILAALVTHPGARMLRDGIPFPLPVAEQAEPVRFCAVRPEAPVEQTELPPEAEEAGFDAEAFRAALRERVEYRYPYLPLAEVAAKRAASHGEESAIDSAFFATARPAFMNRKGLTPAQRGTATHEYMQFADYGAAAADAHAEGERLVDAGFLTQQQAQAVDYEQIGRFFHSELYRRISSAAQVFREERFAIEVPAGEYYDLPPEMAQEPVFLQGVVDCAFVEDGELVIVDYKTDRVRDIRVLAERYAGQLNVYRRAMALSKGLPVRACILYSFPLGEELCVE